MSLHMTSRLLARLILLVLALSTAAPAASGDTPADELAAARAALLSSTRAYRTSLERLLELQRQEAGRAAAEARKSRDLLERGLVSRREVEDAGRVQAAEEAKVAETRRQMAEADGVIGEVLAAIELAKLPPPAPEQVTTTPAAIRYEGVPGRILTAVGDLEAFFRARFGRALPVSALGQTAVHDRLGFDHRDAIDVAVHPDSDEGRALMSFLQARHIPFLAFRHAIPGAATGAHVHVGRPSDRILAARAAGPAILRLDVPRAASPRD